MGGFWHCFSHINDVKNSESNDHDNVNVNQLFPGAIFNSKLFNYQRVNPIKIPLRSHQSPLNPIKNHAININIPLKSIKIPLKSH
jgi:hypothetical protein